MFGIGVVGWSYILAFLIGLVVSLDVGGLLISQHRDFRNVSLARGLRHAILHATVHAGLFLLYFFGVQLLIQLSGLIPKTLIEWLRHFFVNLPPLDGDEMFLTTVMLSSLVVTYFVWHTYSKKIIEDHEKKVAKSGDPLGDSRFDIKFVYALIKWVFTDARARVKVAMALAVAVDMLAITSIIRVYFKGAIDAGERAGRAADAQLFHFYFGAGGDMLQPFIFAAIVFGTVFCCAFFAIGLSRWLSTENRLPWLVVLRIAEPFLVFWILVASVDHLFGFTPEEPFALAGKVLFGAPISGILTVLMVKMRTLEEIRKAVKAGAEVTVDKLKDEARPEPVDRAHALRMTKYLFLIVLGWATLFILTFYITHREPAPGVEMDPGSGFGAFIVWLSNELNLIVLFFLYWPAAWLLNMEYNLNRHFFGDTKDVGYKAVLYPAAAYFVMLFYIHVSYVRFDLLTLHEKEYYIIPLLYLGVMVSLAGLLSMSRHRRLRDMAKTRSVELDNTLSLAEGLNSFAVVLFALQAVLWLSQAFLQLNEQFGIFSG